MYMLISIRGVPVALGPDQQRTTNFSVPPLRTPATVWITEMDPSSVPLNGAVTLSVTPERLKVVPSGLIARKIADPRNPAGHATLVDQVGVLFVGPLAGCSVTEAWGAWEAWAAHAPSRPAPTATTPANHPTKRPFLLLTGFLRRPYRVVPHLFPLYTVIRRGIGMFG